MKKIVTLLLSLFLTVGTAFADNSQIVFINGQKVEKVATKITFNGDNAVVSFSDGSSQSADMSQVVIYLNVSTDIRKVETFNFNGDLQLQRTHRRRAPSVKHRRRNSCHHL